MSEATTTKRKPAEQNEEAAKKSRLEPKKHTKSIVVAPIKLNLSAQPKPTETPKVTDTKLNSIFNPDDESDEEEIPEEAKIRMRNLGRYTPTSSGPNSYGKGRHGFIDRRALLNRQTDAINSLVSDDDTHAA